MPDYGIGRPLQLPVQGLRNMFGGGPGGAAGLATAQKVREREPGTSNVLNRPVAGGSFTQTPVGQVLLDEPNLGIIRQSPQAAIAAYRQAAGQQGRDKRYWGAEREQQLGAAVQALLSMIMPNSDGSFVGDPVAQANDLMAQLASRVQGGQGIGGLLRQQAAGIMPEDLAGYDDRQIADIIGAQASAAGYGYGPFGQMGIQNVAGDLQDRAQQNQFDPLGGPDNPILGQPGALQAFQALLQQYLGTR